MKPAQYNKTILTALLLGVPITGIGVDLYAPSLPAMAHFFGVSHSLIKLTISSFLLGSCLGQLLFGTLSDILGRRRLLLLLALAFALVSFAVTQSTAIWVVIACRGLQGLAAGGISAVIRSQVADVGKDIQHIRRISSYATITWGLGPIIAPWIGSLLQHYWGWEACFAFYTLYGLVLLGLNYFGVPETAKHKTHPSWAQMRLNYTTVLTEKVFVLSVILLALGYFTLTLLSIVGPFLIQKSWGYSPVVYGRVALLIGFAYFSGTLLYRIVSRYDQKILLISAISVMVIVPAICFGLSFVDHRSFILLIIAVFSAAMCIGITYPTLLSTTIVYFPKIAGTASAVMGSGIFLLVSLFSAVVSLVDADHLWCVILLYLIVALISAVMLVFLLRVRRKA